MKRRAVDAPERYGYAPIVPRRLARGLAHCAPVATNVFMNAPSDPAAPLHLRPFASEDFALLQSWFGDDAAVVQWGGPDIGYPLDREQLEAMLPAARADGAPLRESWMVMERADVVGHFQLAFNWRCRQATLGRVAIAPDGRGRGHAHGLIRLAVEAAFRHAELHRLELKVYDFNLPAIRTYERAGFVHEGMTRESVPMGSSFWNTLIMSMLRSDREREQPVSPLSSPVELLALFRLAGADLDAFDRYEKAVLGRSPPMMAGWNAACGTRRARPRRICCASARKRIMRPISPIPAASPFAPSSRLRARPPRSWR